MENLIPVEVSLNQATHTYTLLSDPGLELQSCTEFVNSFFEPFNAKAVARKLVERSPKYRGRTVSSILAEWSRAERNGTQTHQEIARCLCSSEQPTMVGADTALRWLARKHPATEYDYLVERLICAPSIQLAGTIDLLVRNRSTGQFILIDWKTTKKFKRTPYKGKQGIRGPGRRLGDCHLTKYGLQLSAYRYILELHYGIAPEELLLVRLSGDWAEEITVPYRIDDVVRLLEFEGRL